MKNYLNNFDKKNLSLILTGLFLLTFSQQVLFKENHALLVYALKNLELFKNLNNDFVADFTNHVPIYTGLIFFLTKYFSIKSIYFLHYFLLFICTFSIFKILDKIFNFENLEVIFWFSLYFIVFHENSFFAGVAGQSVINQTLQPSSFGVFFFVSLAFYLNSHLLLSILCLCIAVYFHPTYLIHSIFFMLGYSVLDLRNKSYKKIFKQNLIFILFIIPVVIFLYRNFIIEDTLINNFAQKILVEERIPHHANISHWFSYKDLISILIIFIGLFFIRKNKSLFIVLSSITFVSLLISFIQFYFGNYFIALLFPWRSSIFIIPITSMIILSILIKKTTFKNIMGYKSVIFFFIIIFSVFSFKSFFTEEKYNKKLRDKNDLFSLINKNKIDLLITPIYLEDIRLNTSTPIFVNWKFHAFKNDEIIEWYKRVKIINEFYSASNKNQQYSLLNEIDSIQNTSHILIDLNKQSKLYIDCKMIDFNKNYILYDSKLCDEK